jgi:hypothetical protein
MSQPINPANLAATYTTEPDYNLYAVEDLALLDPTQQAAYQAWVLARTTAEVAARAAGGE